MSSLIFATNNKNKVAEIKAVLHGNFEVITLEEAGILIDIPEPHDTLEANATEKSSTIYRLTGKNCFSEDTGLEVKALKGAPGVRSARYAGEQANAADNMRLLLENMKEENNREARFRTVISLWLEGKEYQFEGICNGQITREKNGEQGFGYDPIFIPDGSDKSFALMSLEEKNQFSHRKKATTQLIEFLNNHHGKNKD